MRKFLAPRVAKKYHSPKIIGSRGFTLVELLVTIVVVSIVSSFVFTAASAAQRVARNGQRKSDMKMIQSALGQYYVDQGFYPKAGSGGAGFLTSPGLQLTNCTGLATPPCVINKVYLQSIPDDPVYKYFEDCRHYCYTPYKSSASAGSASVRSSADCDNTSGNQCQYFELSATTEPNSVAPGAVCTLPANFIQHECDIIPSAHLGNYVVTPLGELTIP